MKLQRFIILNIFLIVSYTSTLGQFLDITTAKNITYSAGDDLFPRWSADGSSIIRYGMDKQVEQQWNGTIGGQFQLNKRWMFRSEAGLIGNRKSFLVSINYRFLL